MLTCPRIGQPVRLHYARRLVDAGAAPHHGKIGAVVIRKTKGKPRNHLIRLADGLLLIVPCGNLVAATESESGKKSSRGSSIGCC